MVAEIKIGKLSLNKKAMFGVILTIFLTGIFIGAFTLLWSIEGFNIVHVPLVLFSLRVLWLSIDKGIVCELKDT